MINKQYNKLDYYVDNYTNDYFDSYIDNYDETTNMDRNIKNYGMCGEEWYRDNMNCNRLNYEGVREEDADIEIKCDRDMCRWLSGREC